MGRYHRFHCYATFEIKIHLAFGNRVLSFTHTQCTLYGFSPAGDKIVHTRLQSTERPSTFPPRYRHLRREGLF